MILWSLTFLDPHRINGHPTFLEPPGVVLVKKHNRPSGPLMATGSWFTPRLYLISLDIFRFCNEEYPCMVISNIFAFKLKPDYGP